MIPSDMIGFEPKYRCQGIAIPPPRSQIYRDIDYAPVF